MRPAFCILARILAGMLSALMVVAMVCTSGEAKPVCLGNGVCIEVPDDAWQPATLRMPPQRAGVPQQPPAVWQPAPAAAVRIYNQRVGQKEGGSGTIVDADGIELVLTCWHILSGGVGQLTVVLSDGRQCEAQVIDSDPAWDLAALEIRPSGIRAVPLARDYPRQGEVLVAGGFGPNGRFAWVRGPVLGYVRTEGTAGYETIELSGAVRNGDSGGPMLNERGELAGVIWGTRQDERITTATYCLRVRKFLARACQRRQQRPGLAPVERPGRNISPPVPGPMEGPAPTLPPGPAPTQPIEQPPETRQPALTPVIPGLSLDRIDDLRSANQQIRSVLDGHTGRLEALAKDLPGVVEKLLGELRPAIGALAKSPAAEGAGTVAWNAILAGLGISVPGGGAAIWAAWLIARALRQRAMSSSSSAARPPLSGLETRQLAPGLAAPSPAEPLPQYVTTESRYVPYQAPNVELEALKAAMDQLVTKHPGTRTYVETLKSYADQIRSGMAGKQP